MIQRCFKTASRRCREMRPLLAAQGSRGRTCGALRRRRKIPSWVGLALLVLFIDMAMAVHAWVAVGVVLH